MIQRQLQAVQYVHLTLLVILEGQFLDLSALFVYLHSLNLLPFVLVIPLNVSCILQSFTLLLFFLPRSQQILTTIGYTSQQTCLLTKQVLCSNATFLALIIINLSIGLFISSLSV